MNIILCGFMGSGKTSVGRELSKLSGMKMIDMDDYIAAKAGMSIDEVFSKYGENYFRDLEFEVSGELSELDNVIIAAGGGTLTYMRNARVLRKSGKIVFLDVPLEAIAKRLENDSTRPMLRGGNKPQKMKKLYDERLPIYREVSDVKINGNAPPQTVALDIMHEMGMLE